MAALLLGSSGLMAQTTAYTKPSGFVTHTLKAGQFNLIGLTLHEAVTVTGSFSEVSGTTLTDEDVDFTATLTAGKTYILEITSGTLSGTIQEITAWSGHTITTPADLVADGLAALDTYQMRKTMSLHDVLGATNSAGLQASANADPREADIVFLPKSGGGFDRYFYSSLADFDGWLNAETFAVSNPDLIYTDGIIIQRRGASDIDLVLTGTVKTVSTTLALTESFNYLGAVFPVGSTLDSSDLHTSLQTSANADPREADVVFIPKGEGGYNRYFYSTLDGFSGWLDAETFQAAGAIPISSGLIIQNKSGTSKPATIEPPVGYSDL